MKLQKQLLLTVTTTLVFSCSKDSATEEFKNINGNINEKLMSSINVIPAQTSEEEKNVTFDYDTNKRLKTIKDGEDTGVFVYNDKNELIDITGKDDNLNIEELYESPRKAFETGEVLEYDNNGNPYKILFFDEEYDYSTNQTITKRYYAYVTYDNKPNPYFYTLKAAGIIKVLDRVDLNFAAPPQSPKIVKARTLLPANNPSKLIYKDEDDKLVSTVTVNYVYDNDNYPTSATVKAVETEGNETYTYSITYNYL